MPKKLDKPKEVAARVLIVDDHPAVREALTIRISQSPDLNVCGEADDEKSALKLVKALKPDVAIVDISLKTGDGIDLIKRLKALDDCPRILVWSMHGESLYAERALRAGALGYINKEQATSSIVDAIRQVLDGKVYLSPAMTEKLLLRAVGQGGETLRNSPVASLSDRELEVFRQFGKGMKTDTIAGQMHLSVKTVETYRDRIRRKLALDNATELIHFATQWVMANG
jgi:DNA-binding NarL/FixJ family response regulator